MRRQLDVMRRLDEVVERRERALFDGLGVRPWWEGEVGAHPWWRGPVGWRWRLIMAYHALRGHELGGFW
jgi:hypothetical protein